MSLLQNVNREGSSNGQFDYQSECHCSKTQFIPSIRWRRFDYQSECHCSKTVPFPFLCLALFDYQSECHCSKTPHPRSAAPPRRLTTSQNVTAPKLLAADSADELGLTTSQNVTAPKLNIYYLTPKKRLTTSQNVTAPKPLEQILPCAEDGLSDWQITSY